MPGPTPKPSAIRQRRNKVTTAAKLEGGPVLKRLPALPRRPEGHEWDPRTLAWWRDLRRSPMSAEFIESDRHGLFLLADLVDRYWKTGSLNVAKEIRLQGASFGLTPIDRRRLQWEVKPSGSQERTVRRTVEAPADDPRRLLAIV